MRAVVSATVLGLLLVSCTELRAQQFPSAGSVLQAGTRQLAAGYILYGSSVCMMLTFGAGVDFFVLDPAGT